jgi:hypothetical protein
MNLFKKAVKDKREISLLQQFYRLVAFAIAQILRNTPVTPNLVTIVSFFVSVAAAFLFAGHSYVVAVILAQIACLLDFVDGALARAKKVSSVYGQWVEWLLEDRLADLVVVFGIAVGLSQEFDGRLVWIFALLYVSGRLLMNSVNDYTSLYPAFASAKKRAVDGVVFKNRTFGALFRQILYTRVNHYLLLTIAVIFDQLFLFLIAVTAYVWFVFFAIVIAFSLRLKVAR